LYSNFEHVILLILTSLLALVLLFPVCERIINMADADYFKVGMTISCETCHGIKIQGDVVAFDLPTKMLALSILCYRQYLSFFKMYKTSMVV